MTGKVLAGDRSKFSVGVIFELIEFLTLSIHWRDDCNFTGSITSIGRFGDGWSVVAMLLLSACLNFDDGL